MPYVESFEEFAERHGCPWVEHRAGYLLFANGARWTALGGSEPPADPAVLDSLRLDYLIIELKREETRLKRCKDYIETQSDFVARGVGPPPAEAAFEDLERLRASVLKLQNEIQALRAGKRPRPDPEATRSQNREEARGLIERARNILGGTV